MTQAVSRAEFDCRVAFAATLEELGQVVGARIIETIGALPDSAGRLRLDVAQAVPKGRRMEFVVEKGTELGATAFLPFYSERSVASDVGAEKLARWQRLAQSAAQQCGRREVPKIEDPLQFDALLERFGATLVERFGALLEHRVQPVQPDELFARMAVVAAAGGMVAA